MVGGGSTNSKTSLKKTSHQGRTAKVTYASLADDVLDGRGGLGLCGGGSN
jgi:hypothetical protein